MIFYTKSLQENIIRVSGLHNAKIYSDAITAFRTVYSSEVVSAAKKFGLDIRHDYHNQKAIPLPATLSMLIGKAIGENGTGVEVNLSSPYPFPWRKKTGGLADEFSREAWLHFSTNITQPFFKFYTQDNKKFLRYSVPDIMRESCVNCHNTHPDTPKSDWQVGDVRGILDIKIPMDNAVLVTDGALNNSIIIYSLLTVLAFLGTILMLVKNKTHADELEIAIQLRTRQLELETSKAIQANQVKSEFLAQMSNELRTPLNSILGFGQLLKMDEKELDQSQSDNVQEILSAGHRLLKLINELLVLSKTDLSNTETSNQVTANNNIKQIED